MTRRQPALFPMYPASVRYIFALVLRVKTTHMTTHCPVTASSHYQWPLVYWNTIAMQILALTMKLQTQPATPIPVFQHLANPS